MIWALSSGQPDLYPRAQAAFEGGLGQLVIRDPVADRDALQRLVEANPCRVVLHERIPDALTLALALGIGLHLSSAADARRFRAGWRGPLGQSCHSAAAVQSAVAAGCDWAFLSPIYRPWSKPADVRPPLGPRALGGLGAIALGGLSEERAADCYAHGALGVATLSHILDDRRPDEAAARWVRASAA